MLNVLTRNKGVVRGTDKKPNQPVGVHDPESESVVVGQPDPVGVPPGVVPDAVDGSRPDDQVLDVSPGQEGAGRSCTSLWVTRYKKLCPR